MKKVLLIIMCLSIISFNYAQDLKAYQIISAQGDTITFQEMIDDLSSNDVVCFGELHNNALAHWLELETTKSLHQIKGNKLQLGMEMFEADNQLIIDEYFEDVITKKSFLSEVRKWDNYTTDYAPILDFAKTNKLRFVATNIPRRYANLVFRKGLKTLEKLTTAAKPFIAPLPIAFDSTLSSYKEMLAMMGGHGGETKWYFPMAQASKDATMAHFILKNWQPSYLFLHFNGAFHSKQEEGIIAYLKKENPALKIGTIEVIEVENIEAKNEIADAVHYTIFIPTSMTKTY